MSILFFILIIILAFILFNYFKCAIKEYTGSAEITDLDDLVREYMEWSLTKERYKIITRGLNPKKSYEAKNILERWLISGNNFGLKGLDPSEVQTHPITVKMEHELIEKGISSPSKCKYIINNIINARPIVPPRWSEPIVSDNGNIQFIKYSRNISKERLRILRQYADDNTIVRVALRYSSLISGNQQWNVPSRVYELLIKKYGATVEGFASPFNSQMLKFSTKERPLKFCSLFYDTDQPFGSVGSFFTYDFIGQIAVINPPYILDIMVNCANKCIRTMENAQLDNKPTKLFITVPDWTDASFYISLSKCKFLEMSLHHRKNTYYYEDSNNNDARVIAKFDTTIFILNYGHPPIDNYEDINVAFRI